MASDSVTDEFQTHQSSLQEDQQGQGNDSFAVSKDTRFHFHPTHQDSLLLKRLLALGNAPSQSINVELAHASRQCSGQIAPALSYIGVRHENESVETNRR